MTEKDTEHQDQSTPAEPNKTTKQKSRDSTKSADDAASQSPKRKDPPRIFKIIVIGDSNVGKTCLTYRFCEGRFPTKVEATIGVDFREKTVDIGEEQLKVKPSKKNLTVIEISSLVCEHLLYI